MKVIRIDAKKYILNEKVKPVSLEVDAELFEAMESAKVVVVISEVAGQKKISTFKLGVTAIQPK